MLPTPAAVSHSSWFASLPADQQQLILLSLQLLEREKRLHSHFVDYTFVLFPLVKAYEGFIKFFLYRQLLITDAVYQSTRFRIGRSLNPDVQQSQRDEWWLYDDVERMCGSEVARAIWQAWLVCRNHIVHFFPDKKNHYTLQEVEGKIVRILEVMEMTLYCTIQD